MRLPAAALDLMRGTCAAAVLVTGCTRTPAAPATPPIVPVAQLAPVAPPSPPPLPAVVVPLPPPPDVVATVTDSDTPDAGIDPATARRDRHRRQARLDELRRQRMMAACGRG